MTVYHLQQFLRMEVEKEVAALARKHENNYKAQLLMALSSPSHSTNSYERSLSAIRALCKPAPDDRADDFLRDIGLDRKTWTKLETEDERFAAIMRSLERSIEEGKRKVNAQAEALQASKKGEAGRKGEVGEGKVKDSFEWLKLKNKYPMCEPKLKAKLVQAISDSKNENRIRERMGDPGLEKVGLLDESLVLDEYEKVKIDYEWSEEDEKVFLANIESLKEKFNKTEFLKRCGRFRFISGHELETLAAEEISRRLDQNNKVFLSREFLLDKYYSTTEFLSQQEMRFILKTSPLLSRCVDKAFIKAALKNIQYEDINKLELRIAENIISRFDQIRRAVRDSRKAHKQARNNLIKERIVEFEHRQEFDIIREIARQELKKHKLPNPHKSSPALRAQPMNLQNKKKYVPLNQYHPPSGLFVKDCNQQCNDDLFNHYELSYIEREKKQGNKSSLKNSMSMVQFYTGGPETASPSIPFDVINTICKLMKAQFYEKCIKQSLNNIEIPTPQVSNRTQNSVLRQQNSTYDLDRRPKTAQKLEQSAQATIKRKILENKEKAKGVVYVNKLLVFAAENAFSSLKALNAKFSAEQVNTKDQRGNTALYYAAKNQNIDFINYLLNFGADVGVVCEKDNTPLHHIFKTNNLNLIIRCLCCYRAPNLNALNSDSKTPLAYATHHTLAKLYLQDGVLTVQNRKIEFDNNYLLTQEKAERLTESIGWQNDRVSLKPKQI